MAEIPMPGMDRTFTETRTVPDHELLLRFNGDDDAAAFREWLTDEGWDAFVHSRQPEPPFSEYHHRNHTPNRPDPDCANCKYAGWTE